MVGSRYQMLQQIGSGGIGKVFKAVDRFKGDTVALKVLLSRETELVEAFKKEFLLLTRLQHPNIVKVYDFGTSEADEPYFSMEYIEGRDWKAFVRPLDYAKFWPLLIQICTTLDFLHSRRIIHGDLKPSNILITDSSSGQPTLKFTDFGFAESGNVRESAWWKGTIFYLAPEIIRGEMHSHQADLYSLGVLIYETLYGKRPFDEEELSKLAKSHLEKEVVIPGEPSLPAGLKDLILTLLEKDPIDRCFSAKEVLKEVERISGLEADESQPSLARSLISSGDFVGSEEELSLLKKTLNEVSIERSSLVLLEGESGIGKTRLLEEFKAQAQVEGASVIDLPLRGRESLKAFREGKPNLWESVPEPWVFIFEHLELADDAAIELLRDLIRQARDEKTLVCISVTNQFTRSAKDRRASEIEQEIKSVWGGGVTRIRRESFTEAETRELICSMFAWKEKEEEIAAAVHRKTKGNPLLARQLLESLANEKQIERRDGCWMVETKEIDAVAAPPGLAKEMEGRAGRLNREELSLLRFASVLGPEFEIDLLREILGVDDDIFGKQMENILAERILVRSAISPDGHRICFLNGFTREFIYEQIDQREREDLHRRVGCYLEQKFASQIESHLGQLADHFYLARESDRALRYALPAAQKAQSLGRCARAINLYLRVLELHDKSPSLSDSPKEELLQSLAEQYEADGNYEKSLEYFQKALELWKGTKAGSRNVAQISGRMARIYGRTSEHEKAMELLYGALGLLNPDDSPKEYASVLIDLAWDNRIRCEYHKAIHFLERGISALKGQQSSKEMGDALNGTATVYWFMGNYPEAFENLSKGLDIYQKLGEIQSVAECYIMLGLVLRSQGLPERALEYSQKGLAVMEGLSDPYRLSILENNLSLIYMDLNRWDQALECVSRSVELKTQISDLKGLGLSHNNAGLVYLRKGVFNKSFEHFATALRYFQEIRDKSGVALIYHNLGDLHSCKEEWTKASHYLEKSLRIAGELGEESRIADCLVLLGRIAMEGLNFDLGVRHLDKAASLLAAGRNRLGEAEAQLALAELALRMENPSQAEGYLKRVRPFTESSGNKWFEGRFKRVYADLSKAKGEQDACLENLLESGNIFRELGARYELGKTYLELGKVKLATGRVKEGRALLCEALSIFVKSETEGMRKEAVVLLDQVKEMRHIEKERILTFYRLADILNSVWDTDELLSKALELVRELLNAERGAIVLYSQKDKTFELKVSQGLEPETSEDAIAISRRVLSDVIESDSPLIVENAARSPQFASSKSVIMHNILSILCVPLRTRNRIIGTVYLDHRSLPAVFSAEDIDFLKAFASLIATAIEKSELYVKANQEIFQLKEVLHRSYHYPDIVGKSPQMQEIFNLVEKVANSKTSVLIFGDNGTGKELFAHLIHTRSQRGDGPFIRLNCAALPESILESELFGIEEKTATGVGFRKGKFELADGGTIFLDEIGDMSLSVQAKVLRVLQEKEFERVGGQRPIKVDIRVVSATNMDLHKRIEENAFRKDLYFRLNPIVITIPPLRERKDDIPDLAHYFAERFSKENSRPQIKLTKRVIAAFQNHQWPGNVRELEHLIESATLLSDNGTFPEELLPGEVWKTKELVNLDRYGKLQEVLDWVEKKKIIQALERNKWNQVKAADELGLNETSLRRRIKKYKIKKTARVRPS